MKIAHINNPSGIASILAQEQRKHGHHVEVFVFNKIIFSQFGGTPLTYWSPLDRWRFFKKLKRYEVWHYHYPYGSLKKSLESRNENKIYLKHYHGDDLRGRYDDSFCLVSTPDLLKNAPKARWLPTPIDLQEIEAATGEIRFDDVAEFQAPLKVAHYPYYRNYSGADHYSEVLNKVRREKKCLIINVINQTHYQTLKLLATSDLVIGKIIPKIGWFGKFELEGMALGKPVIAHVSEDLYEKYRPPIFRTTKETFREDLETILNDRLCRDRLSKFGKEYVLQNHSSESVVKEVMTHYNYTN